MYLDLIGTKKEANLAKHILDIEPNSKDLTGQTSLPELMALAQKADFAIGNDTGPMHVCAACNCRSFVLFSGNSNPDLCAPRGEAVTILLEQTLESLSIKQVADTLTPFFN